MKRRISRWVLWAIVLSWVPVLWGESGWKEFRGPTGQGHVSGADVPLVWGPDRNVAWKVALPGRGWSSPVAADGRIYLTGAVEESEHDGGVSLRVFCLDAKDGKLLWDREVLAPSPTEASRMHRKNSLASPTPVISGDRLFVHFGHMGTACLTLQGGIVWQSRELTYAPVHGNGGSPALVEDVLVVTCDGASTPQVAALSQSDGKVRWTTARSVDASKKFSFCTPLVIEVEGRKQVIAPGSDMVGAYDPSTGREIWKVRYDGYSVVPRPVYGHGLVFISTGFDRPVVMAIRPDGRGDVTDSHVAWTMARSGPNTPSMLLAGRELYLVSDGGIASCLDAQHGTRHWQERVGGNYSASPVFAKGHVIFQNEEGKAVVVEAGTTFRRVGENDLAERTLASYAVTGDAWLIRTEDHLYAIGRP